MGDIWHEGNHVTKSAGQGGVMCCNTMLDYAGAHPHMLYEQHTHHICRSYLQIVTMCCDTMLDYAGAYLYNRLLDYVGAYLYKKLLDYAGAYPHRIDTMLDYGGVHDIRDR